MKITIESSEVIVPVDGAPTRVWRGETDNGTRVTCWISRVLVDGEPDYCLPMTVSKND